MALSYDHLRKVQPEDFVVRLFKKERILTFKNVMRGATVASGLLIYNYYRIYSSISEEKKQAEAQGKKYKINPKFIIGQFSADLAVGTLGLGLFYLNKTHRIITPVQTLLAERRPKVMAK